MLNYTTKNLREHTSAQCYVNIYKDGRIEFVSYTTRVITIKRGAAPGERQIECTGTYSPTTRRQIAWFLREYAPDLSYYDIKKIVGAGYVEMPVAA